MSAWSVAALGSMLGDWKIIARVVLCSRQVLRWTRARRGRKVLGIILEGWEMATAGASPMLLPPLPHRGRRAIPGIVAQSLSNSKRACRWRSISAHLQRTLQSCSRVTPPRPCHSREATRRWEGVLQRATQRRQHAVRPRR